MNYFEFFGIPVSLKTDQALLSRRYLELQKKYHPDFHTKSDADSQVDALEMSSVINSAFKTLKNPDLTLAYVLTMKGMLEADEKHQLPHEFLMEMMELNEDLDEKSEERIRQTMKELESTVAPIIDQYNDEQITTAELEELKTYHFKKKYLQRILERTGG